MTRVALQVFSLSSVSTQLLVMQNKSETAKNAVSSTLQQIDIDIKKKEDILESLNTMARSLTSLTDLSSSLKNAFHDATAELLQADHLSGNVSSELTDRIKDMIDLKLGVNSFIVNNTIKKILGVAGLFIPGLAGFGIINLLNLMKNIGQVANGGNSSNSSNGHSSEQHSGSSQDNPTVSDPIESSPSSGTSEMAQNILNDTSLGLSEDKKRTLAAMADALLNEGYEPAFVAGMLGNFACEGSFGMFESSHYISNPGAEPDYLRYMDEHWNYRAEYSGQSIVGKSLSQVHAMISDLDAKGYHDGGSRAGFGFGCAQWTFGRTKGLIEKYMEVAGSNDTITAEQAIKAEGLYMVDEVNNSYHYVYENWKAANANNLSSASAADSAGRIACTQYEKPYDAANKQYTRGQMAESIYNVMMR